MCRIVLVVLLIAVSCLSEESRPRALKRSDVVSMYRGSPELFRTYRITWQGWGGKPANESKEALDSYAQHLKSMHEIGVGCSASVGFRTELRAYMAFDPKSRGASDPVPAQIERTDQAVVVSVPEIDLWTMVKLE